MKEGQTNQQHTVRAEVYTVGSSKPVRVLEGMSPVFTLGTWHRGEITWSPSLPSIGKERRPPCPSRPSRSKWPRTE
ncbi:hypothetical protein Pcinc_038262 [Petrolisthes cinctipes]|uniref:Uncharacterized protein n=1 Tax=Petrolisthes cinctipes TaxID=88211 RepID=A0AAE1BQX0_PETCI|nr:hypothetical protein Pcinc_038262 [Petrolisthes cinctipes]